MTTPEENKAIVIRFNKEGAEQGNEAVLRALMHPELINHTAAPGANNGAEGVINTFLRILRPAMSDMKIEIYDQIAEGDKVTTRKAIIGTHDGDFAGIPPTHRPVRINVIDIVRIKDGKYFEHWGVNNMQSVLAELKTPSQV